MERRLVAILAADVVGYSRLMGEDEAGTLAALKAHRRELIDPKAEAYHGRTVKLMGDGALMEFGSVVDAVCFAVDVQRAMVERNARVPENRQIVYRVGINIGDIIVDGDDIYGDGVNVAARLEALAEPGGICISRTVRNQVRDKLGYGFEFVGEKAIKNIARPVKVFKVVMDRGAVQTSTPASGGNRTRVWLAAAMTVLLVAAAGLGLWQWWPSGGDGGLPSSANRLAILPFANISPGGEDDYFADGMTEELISALSRIKGLRVIARSSVMKYKDAATDIIEIGRDLNVATVLEGSVRKASDKLRIAVQLVDVATQEHLWSEDYDRELKDVFAVQRDVARRVTTALVAENRLATGRGIGPDTESKVNLEAYDAYLRGRYLWHLRTKEDVLKSVEYFERAIAADTSFAQGHAGLASAYLILGWFGWLPAADAYPKAKAAALTALDIDPSLSEAHAALAVIAMNNDYDWATSEQRFRTAIEINPNEAHVHHWYAVNLMYRGETDGAVREIDLALDIDPFSVIINLNKGRILFFGRRYEQALGQLQSTLDLAPKFWFTHFALGFLYLQRREFGLAVSHAQQGVEFSNRYCASLSVLTVALAQAGKLMEARSILKELKESSDREYVRPSCIAEAYLAFPGEEDNFFKWMELEFDQKGDRSRYLKIHPLYDRLRSDPRFQALLERSGLG